MTIQAQLKQAGRRKNQIVKVPLRLEGEPKTVEELLRFSVRFCLEKFHLRHSQDSEVLIQDELEDKASFGKIAFGFFYGNAEEDEGKAILTALQAFEDGIVAVFVDGMKKEQLGDQIRVTEESVVTFVKLALLSGRIW